jgi:hypothetical protein
MISWRRWEREAAEDGLVPITEHGDPLWRLKRGSWIRKKIVEARIHLNGRDVWIKVEDRT